MASTGFESSSSTSNPLDVLEGMASSRDWTFDRPNAEEMALEIPGRWCDYSLYFSWSEPARAIHFSCAMDMRVPGEKRGAIGELLIAVNEKLWMGFFGIWEEMGLPLYRQTLPLRGTLGASVEQMEDLVEVAVEECDRFYPAFQFVVWGGKTPREAVDAAMIDPVGEA